MDRAVEIEYIGGLYGTQQPTEFLCLVLKMLQLQPEKDIVIELIRQEDFKQVG
jgi:pre-mRNA-splicing factor 38A